jgi:multiple sugar transport system ATP-binding protein
MSLVIHDLHKSFGQTSVLNGIEINAKQGEFFALLGASGCGKSTLLHCIAGLDPIDKGEIFIKERLVQNLPPAERNVAMVFQNYALYPTMTVARNITFGLECSGASKSVQAEALARVSDLLKIQDLLDRKPRQLSGGQKQRIAIGRSLVRNPDLFLMDEPMSNLDTQLRLEMRGELRSLHEKLGTTMVFVTHDQTEAMSLASKIAIMEQGRILQVGTPYELYHAPSTLFVAKFIGTPGINIVEGSLRKHSNGFVFEHRGLTVDLQSYAFTNIPEDGQPCLLGIRPESLVTSILGIPIDTSHSFQMTVSDIEMTGGDLHISLKSDDICLTTRTASSAEIQLGEKIDIYLDTNRVSLFDTIQGIRL